MLAPLKPNRISSYDDSQESSELSSGGGGGAPGVAELPQRGLAGVIWRRRWLVLGLTVLALVAGFVYVQNATPIYSSSSRIYVEPNSPRIFGGDAFSTAGGRSDSYIYAQVEFIQSTPIVSKALEKVNAGRLRTFATADNPLGIAKKNLKVEVGKKDDLITISFESPYPEEAAAVVNSVVDAYMDMLGMNQKSTSVRALEILQGEKAKWDKALDDIANQMVEFKSSHPTLSLEYDKNNVALQKLSRLTDDLNQAQINAAAMKEEAASVEAALKDENALSEYLASRQIFREGAVVSGLDHELAEYRSAVRKLEMEVSLLRRTTGDSHPAVGGKVAAIAEMRVKIRELEAESGRVLQAQLKRAVAAAEKKVADIQAMYEESKGTAAAVSEDAVTYSVLEGKKKVLDQKVAQLDTQIRDLSLTANDDKIGRMKAQIVDVARPEASPARPKKAMILAAALVLGLMFGCGSALAADWMDHRLRSVEEVRVTLGQPVLGLVPHMRNRGLMACGQAVALEPMSETAEAFRTVRTAVYFSTPDGEAKKLLVTSPTPGDGKSTTASNLAIAMAKAGQRVVLLDCDFRRPVQHKVFELDVEVGLSSVVAGQARIEDAVRPAPAVEGLDILPCGPIPPNPAELLNSRAFAELLDRLAETYDHVLLDAPPVLAVADAQILAAITDQVVLVLRAEKSTRNMALAARDNIFSVGGQLLGVVVNDVPRAKSGAGYYYSYGAYRYGYYGQRSVAAGETVRRNGEKSLPPVAVGVSGNGNGNGANGHRAAAAVDSETADLPETGH